MTLQDKIKKIISAIKSGVSVYKLDPIGKGSSAKLLLQGKLPTQKKILQMYTRLLIVEKEQQLDNISLDTQDYKEEECIRNEKLRLKKLEVILEAANSGMPHNAINPIGNGGSIRRLLKGGTPKPEKIDEMYNNVIDYQQKQLLEKKEQFIILNPHEQRTDEEKKALILQAVESGILKSKIDPKGWGKSINRLIAGQGVLPVTLDMMYSNLLAILGYTDASSVPELSAKQSYSNLQNQISSLQNVVTSLVDKVNLLETAISVLQTQLGSHEKHTPHRVLGTSLILKEDRVKGKKYRRWYALYTDRHNRRRWIYVGSNVSKAKDKILSWFERHPNDVCQTGE